MVGNQEEERLWPLLTFMAIVPKSPFMSRQVELMNDKNICNQPVLQPTGFDRLLEGLNYYLRFGEPIHFKLYSKNFFYPY